MESTPPPGRGLVLAILGPFGCGYFLSYLTRNVNAVIAPDLVRTFHLGASDLGLLTSVYFLAFALFQPLLGVLLDRFGPRRIGSAAVCLGRRLFLVDRRPRSHRPGGQRVPDGGVSGEYTLVYTAAACRT